MNWNHLLKRIFFLLITVCVLPTSKAETTEQHLKVTLRTIGHEFLLQLNDSTSRVLPIEKIGERYVVQFEREFAFEPDFLLFATFKVLEESDITDNYIVEVENCETKAIIHSFEANLNKDEGLVACKLRQLPEDCYAFYFTVIENESIEESEVIVEKGFNYYGYLILILIVVIIALVFLIKRKKIQKGNPNFINIGLFEFDQKGMTLNLKAQRIELSSKEADLLSLLFTNENKTLEREYILNVVWGDDGDYVGRTLDVFISKLRKKLEADSSIKIINVRGVGYRLVVN